MDLQEPPSMQVTDAPLKVPVNIHGLDQRMRRWLENREANHAQAIDPGQVITRPFTEEERAERERRLRERSQESPRPRTIYRRKSMPPSPPIESVNVPNVTTTTNGDTSSEPDPEPPAPVPPQSRRRRRPRRPAKALDLGKTIRTWLGI